MRRICVVGTGYVGLTTGTCFAELGNDVTCLDIDTAKVENLRRGEMPIYEPGLAELVVDNQARGRLRFVAEKDSADYDSALKNAEFVFIALSTPTREGSHPPHLPTLRSSAQR